MENYILLFAVFSKDIQRKEKNPKKKRLTSLFCTLICLFSYCRSPDFKMFTSPTKKYYEATC